MNGALVCFILPSKKSTAKVPDLHVPQCRVNPGISSVASISPLAEFVKVSAQSELGLIHQASLHLSQGFVFVLASSYIPLSSIAFDHVEGLLCVDVADSFQQRRQPMTEVLLVILELSPGVECSAKRGFRLHKLAAPEEASHLQSLLSLQLPFLKGLAPSVRS